MRFGGTGSVRPKAGVIASRKGRAMETPAPLSNVLRDITLFIGCLLSSVEPERFRSELFSDYSGKSRSVEGLTFGRRGCRQSRKPGLRTDNGYPCPFARSDAP